MIEFETYKKAVEDLIEVFEREGMTDYATLLKKTSDRAEELVETQEMNLKELAVALGNHQKSLEICLDMCNKKKGA